MNMILDGGKMAKLYGNLLMTKDINIFKQNKQR